MKWETISHTVKTRLPVFCCSELGEAANKNGSILLAGNELKFIDTRNRIIFNIKYCPFCGQKIEE